MSLKDSHEAACREAGMSEEQTAQDWLVFSAEYGAWRGASGERGDSILDEADALEQIALHVVDGKMPMADALRAVGMQEAAFKKWIEKALRRREEEAMFGG